MEAAVVHEGPRGSLPFSQMEPDDRKNSDENTVQCVVIVKEELILAI